MPGGKIPAADRSHGGPGSSQQNAAKPQPPRERAVKPGQPTNTRRSQISGGGGERDLHHSHEPMSKGKGR